MKLQYCYYVQVKIVVWSRWQASESSRSGWLACTLSWEHSKSYSHHSVRKDYGKAQTTWVLSCPASSGLAKASSDSTPSTTSNISSVHLWCNIFYYIHPKKFGFVIKIFISSMLSLKIFLSKENNIKLKVSFYNKLRKKLQHCSVCWVQVVILFTLSTVYELFTRKKW